MSFPATIEAIRSLSAKWPEAHAKYVEDKANGPAVIATLKREITGLIPVNPDGGKIVRAQAVSPSIESGNVFLPDSSIAPWIHDFIEEYAAFPNGANDDQVDAGTQALNRLTNANQVFSMAISTAENHMEKMHFDAQGGDWFEYPD
jgi:predicted phage terminase large subunit-like protein